MRGWELFDFKEQPTSNIWPYVQRMERHDPTLTSSTGVRGETEEKSRDVMVTSGLENL